MAELRGLQPQSGMAIRIAVDPSAPIESKYALEFVEPDSVQDGDTQVGVGELTFLIDRQSAILMRGTSIDFVDGMWESGFSFEGPSPLSLIESDLAQPVQALLDDKVNPALASHGGAVELVDIRGETVCLRFVGGCQGCSMTPVTWRQIKDALTRGVRGIDRVIDVTDHLSGKEPYC